ncbi:hypothetical protein BR93DRAFT_939834 [Coniochaeta sp. PMI_546]|nr:hypothetical protein BR93DRAFT_939834 [Coniochaeta sp. PMI_546]
MRSISIFMTAALLAAVPALASQTTAKGIEEPAATPTLNAAVVQGCFSSPGELVSIGTLDYNSKDKCAVENCKAQGHAVAASMGGNECYCGDKYPPKAALVNDTNCNIGCTGYDWDACGGSFFWTVYNTGLTLAVKVSDDSVISSSSSSTTSKPTSVATVIESATVIVSATNTANQGKSSGGSTNTAGIAAGVVVGVVAVAGILGGVFFFMRRRRNKELEEKHRRNAAISTFFPGKPPGSSGGYSVSDARLDPVMAQRRVSNGSIADNEDYSRKILRVWA